MNSDSTFIRHEPCDECGSSDGKGVYTDGHTYCFVCQDHRPADGEQTDKRPTRKADPRMIENTPTALPVRKLTEATCRLWGYGVGEKNGVGVQVAGYRDETGAIVAQKWRDADKGFGWVGEPRKAQLFGQHLWPTRGKSVVITEGELDAMSMSQAWDHKWPVVSVQNGAAGALKSITAALEWLEGFEKIVLMFDMDEPGREAAKECAALLPPGRAFIASLPHKDANECIVRGDTERLIRAFWDAKQYRPDEIVSGEDVWERVLNAPKPSTVQYPWPSFNRMTFGLRERELVTVCAASGVGKSTVVREIANALLRSGETVGYIGLEESVRNTALDLMGLYLNKRLRIQIATQGIESVDITDLREAFEAQFGQGRLHLYDHFGSVDSKNLASRIRYMAKGLGCKWIVLDHISIVVSGSESENERKDIDRAMTTFRTLAEECGFGMLNVSHVSRPKDKSEFEDGGVPRKSDLRGSAAIEQLSDIILSFGRNGRSESNPNVMEAWCIKNRFSGDEGHICDLRYDKETGRLSEDAGADFGSAKPVKSGRVLQESSPF